MDLPFDTVIPFLGMYPKKPKTRIQKNISTHFYVHCSIIYNSQDMEAAQVSINKGVHKTTLRHLHNGILKKEENFTL